MPRSTRLALSLVIAFVLAAPGVAGAQAVPRGSSSGSSSSGSSGGSSSGSGGSTTSSSSGGGESNPPSSGSSSSGSSTVSRAPSRIPTSGSNSPSRLSGATPRSAPEPGGIVSGARTAVARSGGESESVRPGAPGGTAITSGGRTGPGRTVTGVAVPRRQPDLNLVAFPLYGPWGNWYPWYGSAFGWNLGFVYYNPWRYGATQWIWGRYGLWYDPWAYDPYWSTPYYSGYGGYGSSSGYERHDNNSKRMTGSIRLRVSPRSASVYIDGALVGTVDEFDGLSDHLELDGGLHQLELRAEGYESYRGQVDVEVGKTLTQRVSLKQIKAVK